MQAASKPTSNPVATHDRTTTPSRFHTTRTLDSPVPWLASRTKEYQHGFVCYSTTVFKVVRVRTDTTAVLWFPDRMQRSAPANARPLKLVSTTLIASVAAAAITLGALIEPSASDWFWKIAGVWFGAGLTTLLICTRRAPLGAALLGFLAGLAWNAAVLSPLYRGRPMRAFEAGVPIWIADSMGGTVAA